MKYNRQAVEYAYAVLRAKGASSEEALLDIAAFHNQKEEMYQALNDRNGGIWNVFRRNGTDHLDLLHQVCMPKSDLEIRLTLDAKPAKKGRKLNQDKWFGFWEKVDDGRVMASMPDLYNNFKIIRKMRQNGTKEEQAQAQLYLNSLREDFDWPGKKNWLVSGTRFVYSGSSLDARIVQNYRCRYPELTKETTLEVPVYRGTKVEDMGELYLQVLFDTEDDKEEIIQTLEFISGKRKKDIKGWTAAVESERYYTRSQKPERAAGFNYDNDVFLISGDNNFDYPGCSRGVLISPR